MNKDNEIDRLRDIIFDMLDAQGHMSSGIHDIVELYQVSMERAHEIRDAAKSLLE